MTRPIDSALARLFQPKSWRLRSLRLREVALPGGATLFDAGDTADEVFYLRAGRLGVTRHQGGTAQFLGVVRPGEIVGEMALLSSEPRSATVVTTTPVRALVMTRPNFTAMLEQSPNVARRVMRTLAKRLRDVQSAA